MLFNPLPLSVLVMDIFSMTLALFVALSSIRLIAGWNPHLSSRKQLSLERVSELSDMICTFAFSLFMISSLILVYTIARILPGLIDGAMCGAGVIEAGKGYFERAMIYRMITFLLFFFHSSLTRLSHRLPQSLLTLTCSRITLLIAPLLFLSVTDTFRAFWQINTSRPVNCCSVVYDLAGSFQWGSDFSFEIDTFFFSFYVGATLILLLSGGGLVLFGKRRIERWGRPFFLGVLFWIPFSVHVLKYKLTAGYFEVLNHQCLWCLFSVEHYGAGYLLLSSIMIILAGSLTALIVPSVLGSRSPYKPFENTFLNHTLRYILMLLLIYVLLSQGPYILWRIRFGVFL